MNKRLLFLIGAAFFGMLQPLSAAVGDKVTFPDFNTGHVYGEKISADELRGKVVFFEYWGLQCPPCRVAMPRLVEIQKKYGSKGLVVIGSHVQFMSPAVTQYLKETKINFPIYQHKSLPQAPCPGGIPYSVLIGVDGRIIAQGQPGQLYGRVDEAVALAAKGYPILDGVKLNKYKSLEKLVVSSGNNIEARVEELRSAVDEGDAEAQAICAAYDSWLSQEKKRMARLCEQDPMQAMEAVAGLKRAVPSVTEFDEQVLRFREEPAFKKFMAVQKKLRAAQKRQAKGKRVPAGTVKSLQKALAEVRAMETPGMEPACDAMEADIASLESAPAPLREKNGRKQK